MRCEEGKERRCEGGVANLCKVILRDVLKIIK